jgi:hypothetical protein
MVGLAGLLRRLRSGADTISHDGLDIEEQVVSVRSATARMFDDFAACWDTLRGLVAEQ